jgi:hypothetical protein
MFNIYLFLLTRIMIFYFWCRDIWRTLFTFSVGRLCNYRETGSNKVGVEVFKSSSNGVVSCRTFFGSCGSLGIEGAKFLSRVLSFVYSLLFFLKRYSRSLGKAL